MDTEKTKDWEQFEHFEYNRQYLQNEGRLKKLERSIRDHGFLLPILVNNEMYIVDGQHRLEAARRAGVAVTFIRYDIPTDQIPLLIATVNSTSKNWGPSDYLHMWQDLGRETYQYMASVMDEYGLQITQLLRLAGIPCKMSGSFQTGQLTFTETQRQRLADRCKRVRELANFSEAWAEFNHTKSFVNALCYIVVHPRYEHQRMLEQLKDQVMKIQRATSGNEFLLTFTEIYNRKQRKGRISFIDRSKGKDTPRTRRVDYDEEDVA